MWTVLANGISLSGVSWLGWICPLSGLAQSFHLALRPHFERMVLATPHFLGVISSELLAFEVLVSYASARAAMRVHQVELWGWSRLLLARIRGLRSIYF
jgi:hypothetical protein